MPTFVSTKSYHELKKNGKVIDKKMLDAAYDGNKAIIDSYDNNKAHRFEFSKQDIQQMMEKYSSNRSNTSTRSRKPRRRRTRVQRPRRTRVQRRRRTRVQRPRRPSRSRR